MILGFLNNLKNGSKDEKYKNNDESDEINDKVVETMSRNVGV
jgi:hypothetical protein